jgi:mannosyltransferase OCH1-like enzyme
MPPRTALPALPPAREARGIPRIIHQIYLPGADALPAAERAVVAALGARNPGWEQRMHDTGAARAFIAGHYGEAVLALWEAIDPAYYAARADLLRYLLLFCDGGVYLDVKSTALAPLDSVLEPADAFLLGQWPDQRGLPARASRFRELRHVAGGEYLNWVIVAAPGHPFLRAAIARVLANIAGYRSFRDGVGAKGVLAVTGPIAYTRAIHPVRNLHPHRMVAFEELGFRYRAADGLHLSDTAAGRHYAQLHRPVVRRGPLETTLAETLLPPAKRLWSRLLARRGGRP